MWETSLDSIDLYYRTAIAKDGYNAEGLTRLQANFDRQVVARLLQAWTGLRSSIRLHEARSSLAAGLLKQAMVQAQAGAAYACDSYLASEGEAYPNLKWRFEKIKRRFGKDSQLFRRMWSLKAPGDREAGDYVEDVAAFCNEMGMGAYAGWTPGDLRLSQARDVQIFPVGRRYFLVQNKTMTFELDARAASAWRALRKPLHRAELVERMARRWRVDLDSAAREIDGLLREWKRYRLVRES